MEFLSDRVKNMSLSQTIAMSAKARELKEAGVDVISLSLGEPDFHTPDFVKESAKKAIDNNFSTYTPVSGYKDLRQAITKKLKRDNDLNYDESQIVVSTGAKQSITNVVLALINKDEEVLIPAPYWVSYIEIVKLAEGKTVIIPADIDNDFKITPDQLEKYITPNTRAFIFSTPCNPSGSVYSKDELRALAEVFAKYPHVFIISDEIYEHINYMGKHESIAQFDKIYNQVITVNGMSKAFAMTGWRVGYIAAPKWIASACDKVQGQVTSGTNSIAQKASIAALDAPVSAIKYMQDAFKNRKRIAIEELTKIKGFKTNEPQGAFYIFPDISYFFGKEIKGHKISNASDFSMFLLNESHVATVTGEAFGSPNCIRVSYAVSEEVLREAMRRIKNAVE